MDRKVFLFVRNLRSFFHQPRNEVVQRNRAQVRAAVQAHGDRAGGVVAVAHDEHVRDIRDFGFGDFLADLFVARVQLHTEVLGLELVRDGLRVLFVTIDDRQDDGLDRSEPDES
jgi:hypothetical protein